MHLVPLVMIIHTDGTMGTRCARQEAFTFSFYSIFLRTVRCSFALGDLTAKANMAESLSNDGMAIKIATCIRAAEMSRLINQMIDRKWISSCYDIWIIIFRAKMLIRWFQFLKHEDFTDIFYEYCRTKQDIWRHYLGLYEIQLLLTFVHSTIKIWSCTNQAIMIKDGSPSYCILESSQDPTRAKLEVKPELMLIWVRLRIFNHLSQVIFCIIKEFLYRLIFKKMSVCSDCPQHSFLCCFYHFKLAVLEHSQLFLCLFYLSSFRSSF